MVRSDRLSVIAPIYNEVNNIRPLYDRIYAVMESIGISWELVLVNDGSTDGSSEIIDTLYRWGTKSLHLLPPFHRISDCEHIYRRRRENL